MVVDTDTGETIGGNFMKVFFGDIQKLFGLSGTEIQVLLLMEKSLGLGHVTELQMTPARKKKYAKELGMKSHQQITNALRNLTTAGVIRKKEPGERFDYRYLVNPEIMFSGNDYQRAKIIIEYSSGERDVKVFRNAEEAERYFALEPTTN